MRRADASRLELSQISVSIANTRAWQSSTGDQDGGGAIGAWP